MSQVGDARSGRVWFGKKNIFFSSIFETTQVDKYWHCDDNHVSMNTVSLSILKLYEKKYVYKNGATVIPINLFFFRWTKHLHLKT